MKMPVDKTALAALAAWMEKRRPACLRCKGRNLSGGCVCNLPERDTQTPIHVIPLICVDCGHVELLAADTLLDT